MSISQRAVDRGTIWLRAGAMCLLLPFTVAGCANPGPPKPPSLYLPAPAKDLRADRIGDQVHLSWTTSADTTDGVAVKPPLSAEICRDSVPLPPGPAPCTVVGHLAVTSGPSAATDSLPPALLLDPVQLLHYRVRLLNAAGHAADPSNIAFAAAGAAPGPVTGLHVMSAAAGTRILWSPVDTPATAVLLERSMLAPSPQAAAPHKLAANTSSVRPPGNSTVLKPVHLRAALEGSDPGGTLDPSSKRDTTYSYIAWRSRSVTLGGRDLILRSPNSPPLIVTVRDQTPPAIPVGLEAVPDGNAVDLSWEPNAEADLAGYWVERTLVSGAAPPSPRAWQRLNPEPLPAPSFRDTPPSGEPQYLYRVLAADSTGNLSAPSASVTVHLSAPPSR